MIDHLPGLGLLPRCPYRDQLAFVFYYHGRHPYAEHHHGTMPWVPGEPSEEPLSRLSVHVNLELCRARPQSLKPDRLVVHGHVVLSSHRHFG